MRERQLNKVLTRLTPWLKRGDCASYLFKDGAKKIKSSVNPGMLEKLPLKALFGAVCGHRP